jgi:hypothetical protein
MGDAFVDFGFEILWNSKHERAAFAAVKGKR